MSDLVRDILAAEERIREYIRETPVELSPGLGPAEGGEVYLKLENFQSTGSFKLRGAMNKLLCLSPAQRERGVVAASSGNHGAALAYALSRVGGRGVIFVPAQASPAKIQAIRAYGVEVRAQEGDPVLAEIEGRRYAESRGLPYISPYNDLEIVAGQGTVGVELARQIDDLDAVLVALGGGGLISGIATYLKSRNPDVEIVACSPENSPVMHESVRAGRVLELDMESTLSDGTAGGVEDDAVTFDLCRRLVDRWVTVSEEEIAEGMRFVLSRHHSLVEGAAGVAVAAFEKERAHYLGRRVAIVLCGANISLDTLRSVVCV